MDPMSTDGEDVMQSLQEQVERLRQEDSLTMLVRPPVDVVASDPFVLARSGERKRYDDKGNVVWHK